MAQLKEYLLVGQKKLRMGYTTGTCAAAAARGAAELLINGIQHDSITIQTPAGISVIADLEHVSKGDGWARCAVRKDGGDDPDVTDGVFVYAKVEWSHVPGITIDGGVGVGRVTRAGLDQPIGAAAINSTPRKMIYEQLDSVLSGACKNGFHKQAAGNLSAGNQDAEEQVIGETGARERDAEELVVEEQAAGNQDAEELNRGLLVTISVPEGVAIAKKTFNPRLGIEGGISILGTGGIVKPMSEDALIASIQLEMRMSLANGTKHLLVTPGNYGHDFADETLQLDLSHAVQCSNYIGATIDYAATLGFQSILVVGHIGKMSKVAAGIMNTHSKIADGRRETLAAHAACSGASQKIVKLILQSTTTDEVLDILDDAGLKEVTMDSMIAALQFQLAQRAGSDLRIEAVVFSKVHGLLGSTANADTLISYHRR